MSAEGAIYSILASDNGVGAIAGDRISPHIRLQGTALPALVYTLEEFEPVRTLGGTGGFTMATVTIASIGETYASAKSLAGAVITALNGTTGTLDSTAITSLIYTGQTSSDPGIGEGEEDLPYEIITTYRMHYSGL